MDDLQLNVLDQDKQLAVTYFNTLQTMSRQFGQSLGKLQLDNLEETLSLLEHSLRRLKELQYRKVAFEHGYNTARLQEYEKRRETREVIQYVRISQHILRPVSKVSDCKTCGGLGRFDDIPCWNCQGTGQLTPQQEK